MLHLVGLLFGLITTRFKSRARLEAEILILHHQIGILRRQMPKRLALNGMDRLLFIWLYRLFPTLARAVTVVRPETIVRGIGPGIAPIGGGDLDHVGVAQRHPLSFDGSFVR